jgi:endo-1,4-beta-xylanase
MNNDPSGQVMRATRRLALGLALAALVFGAAVPAAAAHGDRPTLRSASRNLLVGTAVGLPQLDTDSTYSHILAKQFDSVTPENAMKWDTTEPEQGVFNFAPADRIVAFAREHGQRVRGHTLVWHNQLPSWLTNGTWTTAELRDILRRHIMVEAGHFKGQVYAWDVVNEVFDDSANLRDTFWLRKLGPGYIADAFRWAHKAAPKAQLYINDYNIEGINAKSTATYNLVKQLRSEGVPITGVGIQGHLGIQYGFPGDIQQNIQRFVDLPAVKVKHLGKHVQVAITELDVRMILPVTDAQLATQASYYSRVVNACLAVKRCVGVTVWGFTDKYSWVPGVFAGQGAADLYDENYHPKPAYWAVLADLAAQHAH